MVFTDFETCIRVDQTLETTRVPGSSFHISEPPVLDCLRELGVNAVALSNNHAWDLGTHGLIKHYDHVRNSGIAHAGCGPNLAVASAYGVFDTSMGVRVTMVGMASGALNKDPVHKVPREAFATHDRPGVNQLQCENIGDGEFIPMEKDSRRILQSIGEARRAGDIVLCYHHNHHIRHSAREVPQWARDWAYKCIDAGADAYICDGPPIMLGMEIYKGKPIFFCLGSFIFHTRTPIGFYEERSWESVVADILFDPVTHEPVELEFRAIQLNERADLPDQPFATRGRPRPALGSKGKAILERFQFLSSALGTSVEVTGDRARVKLILSSS
jgi:poly-gamma-glutamate synthesis protein (capsule biosynthesis protein)